MIDENAGPRTGNPPKFAQHGSPWRGEKIEDTSDVHSGTRKKVLLTGGTGTLGLNVLRLLAEDDSMSHAPWLCFK